VQKEILERNPAAKVHVYAVWFSMIPTDARAMWRWGGGTLTDSRVTHFWDEQKLVGRWFAEQVSPEDADGGIVWDAYYLYAPDAEWTAKPPATVTSGATVRARFDNLNQRMAPFLTP
jgi:hypothetical protein